MHIELGTDTKDVVIDIDDLHDKADSVEIHVTTYPTELTRVCTQWHGILPECDKDCLSKMRIEALGKSITYNNLIRRLNGLARNDKYYTAVRELFCGIWESMQQTIDDKDLNKPL